jgi:hypothetical protein
VSTTSTTAPAHLSVGEVTAILNSEHGLPDVLPSAVSQLLYCRKVDVSRITMRGRKKMVPADLVEDIAAWFKSRRVAQ